MENRRRLGEAMVKYWDGDYCECIKLLYELNFPAHGYDFFEMLKFKYLAVRKINSFGVSDAISPQAILADYIQHALESESYDLLLADLAVAVFCDLYDCDVTKQLLQLINITSSTVVTAKIKTLNTLCENLTFESLQQAIEAYPTMDGLLDWMIVKCISLAPQQRQKNILTESLQGLKQKLEPEYHAFVDEWLSLL